MNNDSEPGKEQSSLSLILRAFKYRNYRLFFAGQGISLIGNWMQTIASSWLVYRLTQSPVLLGVVGFSSQIPTFLLAPFAGVLLDRWKRRTVLIVTQSLMMLQAFLLAFLTITGRVQVWHIIVLSMVMGVITAFDMPGRQTFVHDIIEDKSDLGNAIALNSSIFNGARMIGPSIAGLIIERMGEGICFLCNGISFVAVLAALLAMRVNQRSNGRERLPLLQEFSQGISYTFGFPPIRAILILLFFTSMMGMSAMVLMPVFSSQILKGGAQTMGFLMGSVGIGALVGALYLASRKSIVGLVKMIPRAALILGVGLILFSFSRNLYLSFVLVLLTGFGMMVQMASTNTFLQTVVDEDKRGRVLSIYTTTFMGAMPLGSLITGYMADIIGAPNTVMFGGFFCCIAALIYMRHLPSFKEMVYPLYVKLGLIHEGSGPCTAVKGSVTASK
ncbi:MAG: MFS transporter [Vulcanimicrobiota bacterium]